MASAIFVAPMTPSGPTLDMELISDGTEGYGFAVIGQVPQDNACLVRIWSSEDVLAAMAADANYEFIEDVPDGESS